MNNISRVGASLIETRIILAQKLPMTRINEHFYVVAFKTKLARFFLLRIDTVAHKASAQDNVRICAMLPN